MRVLSFLEGQMSSFKTNSEEIEKGTLGSSSMQVSGLTPKDLFEEGDSAELFEEVQG
jgi:cell division initiation protein